MELNQTTDYILEEFNTDLRTKSNKEHISDKFKSPPFTDDINVNYNDNNVVCVQDSVQEVQEQLDLEGLRRSGKCRVGQ